MNWNQLLDTVSAEMPELDSMERDKFIGWLRDNPDMYRTWRRFAVQAIQSGRKSFSAYMIRERVRWYTQIETKGDIDGFKLSNNLTPYMARTLAYDLPELWDVFSFAGETGREAELPF